MDSNFDFAERLTRLETQLAERFITTEERYRTSRDILEDFKNRLVRIETMIEGLPATNGRNHLLHVSAASLGGGGIMAAIIELIKLMTS